MTEEEIKKRERGVVIATVLASGMSFLFGQTVVLALTKIQVEFGATLSELQWVLNAYTLVVAAFILQGGALGDKFGRKKMFLLGIALFGVMGTLSGFCQSVTQLIITQAGQGLGAALMVPGSLAVINSSVAEARKGRAFGIWAAWSAGVGALAPIIGGSLIQWFGWRSVFFLNLPLAVLAFSLVQRNVAQNGKLSQKHLDLNGTFFLLIGLFCLSLGFTSAPAVGWSSPAVLAEFLIALTAFIAFISHERRAKEPLVPLELFRTGQVMSANVVTFLLYSAIYSFYFLVVLYLQQVLNLSAAQAGLALIPMPVLLFLFSSKSGAWADKVGVRLPIALGAGLAASGYFLLAALGGLPSYFLGVFPGIMLIGTGMTFLAPAVTKAALTVPEELSGTASGVSNAVSRSAGLIAIALTGALILMLFGQALRTGVGGSTDTLTREQKTALLAQIPKGAGLKIPADFTPDQIRVARHLVSQSFIFAYRRIFTVIGSVALLGTFIAVFAMKKTAKKSVLGPE